LKRKALKHIMHIPFKTQKSISIDHKCSNFESNYAIGYYNRI
jgi:hypothetical protein